MTATPASTDGARPISQDAGAQATAGREARAASPRSLHGQWTPPSGRPQPLAVLAEQARGRVPELLPIRHGRMVASPFAFYRGTAALMAADLAEVPRTGLHVQLCGDAHLSNFGAFASPDRHLVFGIDDFDETLPGPFEWDLKRLVASCAVAGRELGFRPSKRRVIELQAARAYRQAMRDFARMSSLDVWYERLDTEVALARFGAAAGDRERQHFEGAIAKAASKDNLRAVSKLTRVVNSRRQFRSDPPLLVRLEELPGPGDAARLAEETEDLIRSYASTLSEDRRILLSRFRVVDIARKVVGVGSVGTRDWVVLMLDGNDQPLLLQIKEAQASVLEPHLGTSTFGHHGQRVVEGQRLIEAESDILLGWERSADFGDVSHDFYVRQVWDMKGAAVIETMSAAGMGLYGSMCGWSLARAHARSGDAIPIATYLGSSDAFDMAMVDFAESYADQNERDHAELRQAIDDGEIEATTGV